MNDQDLISDRVVSTAERLENTDDLTEDELGPLDYWVKANLDGTIKEIYATLCTGGPHIEVALYAGRVDGYWGGDEHSALIFDDETDDQLEQIAEHRRHYWEDVVLA
jgi:hypothetical protein